MNANLPHIPERDKKKRYNGITMVMDKGLSLRQVEDYIQAAGRYVDYVKLGFGTALVTERLEEKIQLYRDNHIEPYFGGTLYEVYKVRNLFDDFRKFLLKYDIGMAEVSDGSIYLDHDEKLKDISRLAEDFTVLSEVGSKRAEDVITPDQWVSMMRSELEAGSHKVIAEARESGTIGIYNKDGSAKKELIDDISHHVKLENILWEAPQKTQQVWFIKHFGSNVNLGNIAFHEVIPLETLRTGLRGDTFFHFLPDELKENKV
ncbi:MAG TPA: phosphosulfolactate synthase [Bacteroidales bacterium]|nr:phosphosulfolactate synthase [Bacteroidales bacterium]